MKYNLPNQEKSLFITFESSYENLKVYFDGALLGKVERSDELVDGVTIPDSPVGTIDLRFPTGRRSLEVRVDELLCTPDGPSEDIDALRSFDKIFWMLAFFGVLSTLIQVITFIDSIENPVVLLELFIGVVAIAAYIIAAIFIRKEQAWAYLMGTIVFTISSLLYLFSVYIWGLSVISGLFLVIRLAILALLYYKMTSVFKYFKKTNDLSSKHTLLDDF